QSACLEDHAVGVGHARYLAASRFSAQVNTAEATSYRVIAISAGRCLQLALPRSPKQECGDDPFQTKVDPGGRRRCGGPRAAEEVEGGQEDAPYRAVEPLRARVRQVVQR